MLQLVPAARLRELATDGGFLAAMQAQVEARRAALRDPGWFAQAHAGELALAAYFSMEFGLHEALPIYAGRLGILAGDHLKAASDLGVPLVGVGILWHQGYFRQFLGDAGRQQELYPHNEPAQLPIQPVRTADGDAVEVALELPGRLLRLRAWQATVGRVRLFLLDSNHPLNSPADRGLGGSLYAADAEVRFLQELVLGIGGWRLLDALGLPVEVCHLNEGHAAFVVVERARTFMRDHGVTFEDALWTAACGRDRWRGVAEHLGDRMAERSDEELWRLRTVQREALVRWARARLRRQLAQRGLDAAAVAVAEGVLDPGALTLGFARRFTAYKRPGLLLTDRERLRRLLTDPAHPVQLVVAGKAHPADLDGKRVIAEWVRFAEHPDVRHRVVFVEDYDMSVAKELAAGVDVWVNTPRRPWEACGTSGMKVLANGGLNLSELDGWWAEAYEPDLGWALGDGREHADGAWDAAEADALYGLLERVIVPAFYDRGAAGIPRGWTARVRASLGRLAPRFGTGRMLREYLEARYVPAARQYRRRTADGARAARALAVWAARIRRCWPDVAIEDVTRELRDGALHVTARVRLGGLGPEDVRVELIADPVEGHGAVRVLMCPDPEQVGTPGEVRYVVAIATDRHGADFTPRVAPHHPDAILPLELPAVRWP